MTKLLVKLFVKEHEDTANSAVRERYGKLAGVVGIVSNLVLCAMKIVIGLFSRSIAIVADGVNNLADASSSIITLVGFKLASAPEDKEHPYGHARIEYLTGLIISIVIIVVGVQLLRSSVGKVVHPETVGSSYVTIVMLLVAIGIKLWQTFFNLDIGKRIDSLALLATGADSRNDVIATSAVLVSILVDRFTGLNIDGYMGCLVALFIMWSGIQLVRDTSGPLLGEAPDKALVDQITATVKEAPSVLGIHDLIVHNYGPGKIFASIHIEVDANGDLLKSHDMIDNIERLVKESLHIEFVAHMDPIVTDDPILNKMRAIIEDAFSPLEGVESMHDFRMVPGPTHTNIIFDVVLAYDCRYPEKQLLRMANEVARREDDSYFVIITFDRAYTDAG